MQTSVRGCCSRLVGGPTRRVAHAHRASRAVCHPPDDHHAVSPVIPGLPDLAPCILALSRRLDALLLTSLAQSVSSARRLQDSKSGVVPRSVRATCDLPRPLPAAAAARRMMSTDFSATHRHGSSTLDTFVGSCSHSPFRVLHPKSRKLDRSDCRTHRSELTHLLACRAIFADDVPCKRPLHRVTPLQPDTTPAVRLTLRRSDTEKASEMVVPEGATEQ